MIASGRPRDLRMPLLAVAAWAGSLAYRLPWWLWASCAVACLVLGWRRRALVTVVGSVLVFAGVVGSAELHHLAVHANPVADLAAQRAVVAADVEITSDPRLVRGRFATSVLFRGQVRDVSGRGGRWTLRTPVLVVAPSGWPPVALGSTVRVSGRLSPSDPGDQVAAVLSVTGQPSIRAGPGPWWRGASAVRDALRESVAHRSSDVRGLLPALVDGDTSNVPPALDGDFRATGLTHLEAVSGTNLTIVVGFLCWVAAWLGVRGRWLRVVAALGIAGFILLARTEPSVLRAAVMGGVGLLALGSAARHQGVRALAVAVVGLLLVDPALGAAAGFALSVLATAGILFLAPAWRDGLMRWLPRWLAEAIAVPTAAQLACTPLIAAMSGQVSLVAVFTNLAAEPAVGPATVLGLLAALVGVGWPGAAVVVAVPAGWCVSWIAWVARRGADLPGATMAWGTSPWSIIALLAVTVGLVLGLRWVFSHRWRGLAGVLIMVLAVLVPLPALGWPPQGWIITACDVGQGDGLVLNAGPHTGVVVDAGPDPKLMDTCLRRLDITDVPLVVLTHFHADHVDGLPGVFRGRRVGAVEVTPLADPPQGVALVAAAAARAGLRPRPSSYLQCVQVGEVTLETLWPLPDEPTTGPGDGSTANSGSVVLLAVVRGVRILLSGDVQPDGQAEMARAFPGLTVDVLKVPHHGSRYQDLDFLLSLHARVALTSVGADNTYGHPAASTLAPLAGTGAEVLRTDRQGDLTVIERQGVLLTQTSR